MRKFPCENIHQHLLISTHVFTPCLKLTAGCTLPIRRFLNETSRPFMNWILLLSLPHPQALLSPCYTSVGKFQHFELLAWATPVEALEACLGVTSLKASLTPQEMTLCHFRFSPLLAVAYHIHLFTVCLSYLARSSLSPRMLSPP